jgi:hypothetical protein
MVHSNNCLACGKKKCRVDCGRLFFKCGSFVDVVNYNRFEQSDPCRIAELEAKLEQSGIRAENANRLLANYHAEVERLKGEVPLNQAEKSSLDDLAKEAEQTEQDRELYKVCWDLMDEVSVPPPPTGPSSWTLKLMARIAELIDYEDLTKKTTKETR